jgi:ABC-type dipeptide/oligopeptide/nickel transport system permease component
MVIEAIIDRILLFAGLLIMWVFGIIVGWVSAKEQEQICQNCKRTVTFGYNTIQKKCKCGKILTRERSD